MQSIMDMLAQKDALKFVAAIEPIFKSAPHLPKGLVSFFVEIAPLVAGFVGIVSGVTALAALTGGTWLAGYGMTGSGAGLTVSALFGLVTAALLLLAVKPLHEKKVAGWMLLFWITVLSFVVNVVLIVLTPYFSTGIIGAILGVVISMYVLFEMKSMYGATMVEVVKEAAAKIENSLEDK